MSQLILKEKALDWALLHLEKYGDTTIFPLPFEYQAIRQSWPIIKDKIKKIETSNIKVRPCRRCLTPKHAFGFRIPTQLDPLDTIIYSALVLEIGNDIENTRIPIEKNIVFSNRFKPTAEGAMYDKDINWQEFQKRSSELGTENSSSFVVIADIADFYQRIYIHPLENALSQCTKKFVHSESIIKFIKGWNHNKSFGIPIGPSASNLLAELILDDVDKALLTEGVNFCRYVDDYRIFCSNEKEAHNSLALLANILFDFHGLTLQQHKTEIVTNNKFIGEYVKKESDKEINSLARKLRTILNKLGIDTNPYIPIEFGNLPEKVKLAIQNLNLTDLLKEELEKPEIDFNLIKFLLRRISQFDNVENVNLIFQNIHKLYPLFPDVIYYIQRFRNNNPQVKRRIGENLLGLLDKSFVGHLDFHQMWIFNTFTKTDEWDNQDQFPALFKKYAQSEFAQGEIIHALGRSNNQSWFRFRKSNIQNFTPWLKRAFLASASCLPEDEYDHWTRSIKGLDLLEETVIKWAKQNRYFS